MVNQDRTFIDAIKNYYPSEIQDTEKHENNEIENIFHFDKLKQLLVVDRDSKKFKVYNSKTG